MGHMSSNKNGKELNIELNILPILDILSVLICFLLLTAVFIQIGTIDTRQAVGDNTAEAGKNPPSMWITVESNGDLTVSLRDMPATEKNLETQIRRTSAGLNWDALNNKLQELRQRIPDLKTGIVRPGPQTPYKDVIKLMDQLKQFNFDGVGLSPLG